MANFSVSKFIKFKIKNKNILTSEILKINQVLYNFIVIMDYILLKIKGLFNIFAIETKDLILN